MGKRSFPLPPKHVLEAYMRLIDHRQITVRQAAVELELPWSTLNARVRRRPADPADIDARAVWLNERRLAKALAEPVSAETAKRRRLEAELEKVRSEPL